MEQKAIITVKDLYTYFYSNKRCNKVLNGISFELYKGRTLCIVGESGCGKSVTASCIMQLLPELSRIESGSITYHSDEGDIRIDQLERNGKKMRSLRGHDMAMIFQDPMTALNPVKTVGEQIAEVVLLHSRCSKVEALKRAQDMLAMVGIVPERYKDYPHQFSGGMKQRIVIAIALACEPELLIADEPTTALDVTIQAQILDMMRSLQKKQGTSMILITHDLGVVAEMCDHCAVMYAGELVEYGTVEEIFDNPKHPYTKALYQSIPSLDKDVDRLHVVPGMVTDPSNLPEYCSFADRCEAKCDLCEKADPKMIRLNEEHCVKCLQYTKEWEGKINE